MKALGLQVSRFPVSRPRALPRPLARNRRAWKLVLGTGSGGFSDPVGESSDTEGQLYNLKDDPSEQTNRWDDRPDIVQDLMQELAIQLNTP